MDDLKQQLKILMVDSLRLEDITPEEIKDDQPLLDGGLEIDSIDILQLIVDIERKFGIKLVKGKFVREMWTDVNSLTAAIQNLLNESGQ